MKSLSADARRARQIIARLSATTSIDGASIEELRSLGDEGLQSLAVASDSPNRATQIIAGRALALLASRKSLAALLNAAGRLQGEHAVVAQLLWGANTVLEPRDDERVRPFLERIRQNADDSVIEAIEACLDTLNGESDSLRIDVDLRVGTPARQDAGKSHGEANVTVPRAASMDLIQGLSSRDENERRDARGILLRHPDRHRIVTEHLHHPDPYMRRSVLEVAAVAHMESLRRALLDIAQESTRNDTERALALRGVTTFGPDPIERQIVEYFITHRDVHVRAEALRLCAASKDNTLVNIALSALTHDEPWVRRRVAEGWAGSADASRQHDVLRIANAFHDAAWLQAPSKLDLDAFEALCGGMLRLVELGGVMDSATIDLFTPLRSTGSPEIEERVTQWMQTLAHITGTAR